MIVKRILVSLALLVTLAIGLVAGAYSAMRLLRPKAPDLSSIDNWILVKSYNGKLDEKGPISSVKIYVYRKFSDMFDPHTVLQNRIEVNVDLGSRHVFSWQSSKEYAGGWCEIMDLDLDHRKEFLLFDNTHALRIVRYTAGMFDFRPKLDTLGSWTSDIQILDLDNNGSIKFLAGDAIFDSAIKGYFEVPRIKQWLAESGFIDVSAKYPRYYKDTVLPDLLRRQATAKGAVSKKEYQLSIDFIRSTFLSEKKH